MVLGRLTHYAFDALAISTVLAGVKKQTGFGYVFNLLIPSHCPSTWLLYLRLSSGRGICTNRQTRNGTDPRFINPDLRKCLLWNWRDAI